MNTRLLREADPVCLSVSLTPSTYCWTGSTRGSLWWEQKKDKMSDPVKNDPVVVSLLPGLSCTVCVSGLYEAILKRDVRV